MALYFSGLRKAKKYDWKDSNMALFGSDTDKKVKSMYIYHTMYMMFPKHSLYEPYCNFCKTPRCSNTNYERWPGYI